MKKYLPMVLLVLLLAVPIRADWKSPTSCSDANGWTNCSLAYDGNIATFAYYSIPALNWSPFVELSASPAILCNKVRVYSYFSSSVISAIDMDVYYKESWHDVYSGALTPNEWLEKDIPDGSFAVSKTRTRYYNSTAKAAVTANLNELEIYQIPWRPLVEGSLVSGSPLIGKGLVR